MDKEMPQLTVERAIEILDPTHREHYDSIDVVNEACKMGMEALALKKTMTKRIAELETQNNDLFYKLNGVMLSVDKWLEGEELKQDEVNRAITMREKTLQIVEKLEAEIERLQKTGEEAVSCFTRMESLYKIKCKELEVAKSEAYREFAEEFNNEFAKLEEVFYVRRDVGTRVKSLIRRIAKKLEGDVNDL